MERRDIFKNDINLPSSIYYRSGSSGNWPAHNVGRDILGSITSVQTASGTIEEQRSYDPFVQDPALTQNYNRFAYALNCPLKYTDESGEFLFSLFLGPVGAVIDAACWGAAIGGASYTVSTAFSKGGLFGFIPTLGVRYRF